MIIEDFKKQEVYLQQIVLNLVPNSILKILIREMYSKTSSAEEILLKILRNVEISDLILI